MGANAILTAPGALLRRANLPAFTLAFLLLFDLLVAALLLAGGSETALGRFARDFQAWCFRIDPDTGRLDWLFPAIFFGESLLLAGIVWAIWGTDLLEAAHQGPRRLFIPLSSAAAATAFAAYALAVVGKAGAAETGRFDFPAEDLRTAIPLAAFSLTDQDGQAAAAPEPEGRVQLITSFYAHCASTCPAIFRQVKGVLDSLTPAERERVRVLAITMDPERDDPARLKERAEALGLEAPAFRLVTGDPPRVHALLDRLGFARRAVPETGEIEHANLMILVDARGRIAYRFSLGEIQEAWMAAALRLLVREAGEGSASAGPAAAVGG